MAFSVINGRKALGPEKARCPSVGECQDQEEGVNGLISSKSGEGICCLKDKSFLLERNFKSPGLRHSEHTKWQCMVDSEVAESRFLRHLRMKINNVQYKPVSWI